MSPKNDQPGVAIRVAETIRSFFSDDDPNSDVPRGFEAAAQAISESLARWRSTGGLMRMTESSGRDRLTAVGSEVEVVAPVGRLTRLVAARIRIRLGAVEVLEALIDGPQVTARARLDAPGIYPQMLDTLDRSGRVLVKGSPENAPIVQVVAGTPTAAIDASLLLDLKQGQLDHLCELHRRGWALVFFDFHPTDRQQALRAALATHGLPRCAILVHPNEEVEFKTLGIDFHSLFAATRVRRIRADGVPLVLLISNDNHTWAQACKGEEIECMNLAQLGRCIQKPQGLARWTAAAESFYEQFKATPPLVWRLDRLCGACPISGNRCSFELDNRRARERLFELIDAAVSSIHLQFYILNAGHFTEHLAVHLIRRARAGVRVRVIVDALFSTQDVLGIRNPVIEGLGREPGIDIVAVSPIAAGDPFEVGTFKRRNHRKIIVVDGEAAIVGGRNCSDEYYIGFDEVAITDWTPHERIPWLDAHVEIHGPLVGEVQRAFMDVWKRSNGPVVEHEDTLFPALKPAGTTTARLVLHEGLVDTNTLGAYEALIDGAAKHLYILNDFPILATLRDALLRALARGVRVELLTGSGLARRGDGQMLPGPLPRELFEYMTKHRLEPLIHAGARAYEYTTPPLPSIVATGGVVRPYVHAKVMTADGQFASVGSANLDVTASYWEDEANIVIEDPPLVRTLEAKVEQLIAGSYRLDTESAYWRREASKREVASRLWPERLYS